MCKKIILSFSIIVMLFASFLPKYAYATSTNTNTNTTTTPSTTTTNNNSGGQSAARDEIGSENDQQVEKNTPTPSIGNNGISKIGKTQTESKHSTSLIVSMIAKIFSAPAYAVQMLMYFAVKDDNDTAKITSTEKGSLDIKTTANWFTIERAVFGKVALLNTDFFDVNTKNSSISTTIKKSVASWYQVSFTIAQIFSIIVLIYIGIRMAMASTAEQKVNSKILLKNWMVGFALLFLLQYIIVIVLKLNNFLVSLVPSSLLEKNFELNVIGNTYSEWETGEEQSIWSSIIYIITYWVLIGFEVYFLIKYFKRFLTIALLIIVAPLITVTYAIDKANDGNAKAYTTWMSLFLGNVFMQSAQAFLYAIFIFSASAIAEKAPILAIVFFVGLTKGEDVVFKLFNLNK